MTPRSGPTDSPNFAGAHLSDEREDGEWANRARLLPTEEALLEKHVVGRHPDAAILDVGTGGGIFLLALHERGFRCLAGIDLSPHRIAAARARAEAAGAQIGYSVQDAADLKFADGAMDIVIALQQITSLIEAPALRLQALREYYRVLAPGGSLLCSFLDWQARRFNPLLGASLVPIKVAKGELRRLSPRYLPWLKLRGRLNVPYLWQRQPYGYWAKPREMEELLTEVGFATVEMCLQGSNSEEGCAVYFAAHK